MYWARWLKANGRAGGRSRHAQAPDDGAAEGDGIHRASEPGPAGGGDAGTRIRRHERPGGVPAMRRRYTATARNLFTKAWYLQKLVIYRSPVFIEARYLVREFRDPAPVIMRKRGTTMCPEWLARRTYIKYRH